jgi:hypothetical protein
MTFAEMVAHNNRVDAMVAERNRLAAERVLRPVPLSPRSDVSSRQVLSPHPDTASQARIPIETVRRVVLEVAGRRLWAELHRWAIAFKGGPHEAARWLQEFAGRVPQAGCGCRTQWDTDIDRNPPPLDQPEELFEWTVVVHNFVNLKLGKSQVSLQEARDIWSSTP